MVEEYNIYEDEFADLRIRCQVCGSKPPKHYGLVGEDTEAPDGVFIYLQSFHLCDSCAKKFIESIQVALPDIIESATEDKKPKFFSISGYWKDTGERFEGIAGSSRHRLGEEEDAKDVCLFGLSEGLLEEMIMSGENTSEDFVVTSFLVQGECDGE